MAGFWRITHYAVRRLMHQGASSNRMRQAEVYFASHVQLMRPVQKRS